MAKPPGQPQTPAFEFVKTQYWFNHVRNLIREELIEECEQQLRKLTSSKKSDAIYRKESRSTKNKLKRLKASSEDAGLRFSEMQKHLEKKELDSGISRLFDETGTGKFSSKVWGRYARGTYTPSRILDDLVVFYPDSKLAYEKGPNNIFQILESETLEEAYLLIKKLFLSSLESNRCEHIKLDKDDFVNHKDLEDSEFGRVNFVCRERIINGLENFSETTPIYQLFINLQELFFDLKRKMSKAGVETWGPMSAFRSYRTLNIEDAACLYLCFASTSFKFLGYKSIVYQHIFRTVLFEALNCYGIDKELWLNPKGKNDTGVLAIVSSIAGSSK